MPEQVAAPAHGDAPRLRVDSGNEDLLALGQTKSRRRDADAPPLPHGVELDTCVLTHDPARSIHDLARLRRRLPPHEPPVVSAGDEADLLAVRLVSEMEPGISRKLADLLFRMGADGQEHAAELLLSQPEQHVGLVLPLVDALPERPLAVGGVAFDAGVVAGGDVVGVHHRGALHEEVELDAVVARDARMRCAPALVLTHEVGDDVLAELTPRIHDVVGHTQRLAYTARILDVLDGAAALVVRRYVVLVRGPEPHRDADNVVALPVQQVRGHRRVDAARHRGDNPLSERCFDSAPGFSLCST